MRRLGKWLGRALLLVVLAWGLVEVLPRETVAWSPTQAQFADPEAFLSTREAAAGPITPGTQGRIVWAGAPGDATDWVVLYLHGFSATSEELRPVPDQVAAALGANLVFARLQGHGQTGAALGAARAGDWVADTEAYLDVARSVGDRVVVIGTSTGGTLAAFAATEASMAERIAGIAFVSPNFRLANPMGVLLEWPLARHWAPWIMGAERSFPPLNADHAMYWTTTYPAVAAVSLGTLMRETRSRGVDHVDIPALFLFSDADQVVSADAVRDAAAAWGGAVTLAPQVLPEDGVDRFAHVIAGDILSPAMTERVAAQIIDWASALDR